MGPAVPRPRSRDDVDAMRPSPFLALLDQIGDQPAEGVYHRLTGTAFGLDPSSSAVLRALRDEDAALDAEALDRWGEVGAALAACGFLVPDLEAAALLGPFRRFPLFLPAHGPAVIALADGAPRVWRPEGLSVCELPRPARLPRVLCERIPPAAVPLVRAAAAQATLGEALDAIGDPRTGLAALLWLTDPDRQLVRVAADSAEAGALWATHQFPIQSFRHGAGAANGGQHHRSGIDDADLNFDWTEPTLSHAFREPSAAFGGQSYGQRFADRLADLTVGRTRLDILEIGGGLGVFGCAVLARLPARGFPRDALRYELADLSPRLLEAQARRFQAAGFVVRQHEMDAQRALPSGRFDLILANEMIADLEVAETPEGRLRPVGALALIARLSEHLRPGGMAILTEYGGVEAPMRAKHLNHPEYSIPFPDLAEAAGRSGLGAELLPLADFLGVDGSVEMLVAQQERMLCLAAALANDAPPVAFRAYDREETDMLFGAAARRLDLVGLRFARLDGGGAFGPDLRQFFALILRRT